MEHPTSPSPTPTPGTRRATIEDVAAAAGVSVATVSRAMRGLPNVAPSTRQRVARIATEMSYRPDPAAARLATGRARSIALVVPLLNSWYFSQVVAGAEAVCAEEGYDILVISAAGDVARRALLDSSASIHRRVDGLVFVDVGLGGDDLTLLADRNLAVVTIGNTTDRFPSIGIDDIAVAELAVGHLLGLGHTRIGLIGGQPDDERLFQVPGLRRIGYERALERAGLRTEPELQAAGNFSVLGGREAMAALLRAAPPPTAVFAMSDEMAFGAILAVRDAGLAVPGDVSLVGVDDHDVSIVLGLTTVRQAAADHGSRAARLVIDQLSGRPVDARRHESPIDLVLRTTTCPPRGPETSSTP